MQYRVKAPAKHEKNSTHAHQHRHEKAPARPPHDHGVSFSFSWVWQAHRTIFGRGAAGLQATSLDNIWIRPCVAIMEIHSRSRDCIQGNYELVPAVRPAVADARLAAAEGSHCCESRTRAAV